MWTLLDVGVSGKLKMAALTGSAVFDLRLTPPSESVHTSPAVLVNLENVGVAFGIPLLSCVQAELNVF